MGYNIEGRYISVEGGQKFEKANGGNFIMCSNGCSQPGSMWKFDNVSVSLDSETDTLNNTNSPKAEQKEDQIDYIQAEYRIIDAKELYVTADNLEATTDSDGNETYINTENYTNQNVCDNRDKETVLQ